jgi:hypothetical protein
MNKKLKETVNRYFKLYPKREKLYATEDGNVFLEKSPAVDHANKTNQKWHVFDNPAKMEAIKEAEEKAKRAAVEAKKAAGFEKLKTIELDQMSYNEAYDLATDLLLPLTDKKKETVFAALADAKDKLTTKGE